MEFLKDLEVHLSLPPIIQKEPVKSKLPTYRKAKNLSRKSLQPFLCYTAFMKHIARSTLIIAIFFGLEKLLGFIRNVIIARTFQLSPELDAFNAANNIPDLIFALISGGALAMAFIPVLTDYRQNQSRTKMWELFSQVTNGVFLVTALVSILVALLSNQFVSWEIGIAPGFSDEQQMLVASLMRLNLIATLLFSLGGLAIAGLQSQQHFLIPALAPTMYDVGSFFGILILAPKEGLQIGSVTLPAFDLGIYGLVYGVIIGAALFLLIQLPVLFKFGFKWKPLLKVKDPGMIQVVRLMGPRVLTVFFIQLVFIIQDNLASRLPTGAVTALVYGWLFMQLPESLIGTALGTALLPTLSEQASREESNQFRLTLEKTIRVITGLTIPIGIVLAVNIAPFIHFLGFDPAGTQLVIWTTRAYLVGLAGHSLLEIAVRSFYAHQNAKTPLFASGLTMLAFLAMAVPFSITLGAPGIGLANSLAYTAEAIFLLFLFNKFLAFSPRLKSTLLRSLAACLTGVGLSWLLSLIPFPAVGSTTNLILKSIITALAMTAIIPWLIPEIKDLLNI
jgi:putative peptidoglycan lipid II flippase